jgi:excisionase family DNA binding protein
MEWACNYMAKQNHTDEGIKKAQGIQLNLVKRLFTLKEAAKYLGRSEWGMRTLVWAQEIPVVKINGGRKIFIDINDLNEFIERHKSLYH